jgi:integrase
MARNAKPWFYRGWWMVWLGGRRCKLAEGKHNKKQAELKLLELRLEAAKNPHSDDPEQTVASVIDTYQGFAHKRLAASTNATRDPYLQSFAESHGWRNIRDCKPHHMEAWVDAHPGWKSDKSSAIRNVQAAFNWAVKTRLISQNPFRGVSHHTGAPRRDMTLDEFQAVLRNTNGTWCKRKPTPAARFRQVLIFLWYTGCRPKEAATLRWSDKGMVLPTIA